MNIILLSSLNHKKCSIDLHLPGVLAWGFVVFMLLGMVLLWAGYQLGSRQAGRTLAMDATEALQQQLDSERSLVEQAREEVRNNLDALALRIGALQAHMMRLDAVGGRLVDIGKLDQDEFDFATEPALGGLAEDIDSHPVTAAELAEDLDRVDQLLADREKKLLLLQDMMLDAKWFSQLKPSGRPITKGWISSTYGKRTDPFTGRKTVHHGVDFAGKRGSEVKAVATGVVVRSEDSGGYGNLVEIRHTDGFTTRYAHNQKNLVKTGDTVAKGQVIALLGSSGRSSGPHVHFEVRKDGRVIDPKRYIRSP